MNELTMTDETDKIKLAADFVNSTSRHIFLTGKAGTGKTTFLQNLSKATHKKHIIVAPTGIAALNAGGVTIHSQFLFPLGSYNPDENAEYDPNVKSRFYNSQELVRRHPLNSVRNQVLRDIDLMIIDEVSMLRADLLDAVDFRLRSARRNHRQPFGGVQLLLIGDLFQLPPIVKDHEWEVLRKHYPSPHFFSSIALNKDGYVYLELDKVFRQTDNHFIRILNNLRSDNCTQEDIDVLNSYYQPQISAGDGIITLTTHNYQANAINKKALESIDSKAISYKAEVKGDFPEQLYPLDDELVLKSGAQVMFIKNDPEGRYYNGKLATVQEITDDKIKVKLSGEETILTVGQHVWENTKYSVDENKEITEDVVGTFSQYPLKLAWAITVHKSQGLTFERAIIDVGQAFAPGQVYVALSRLRSLDGLILRTKINNSVISNDVAVVSYQKSFEAQEKLENLLKTGQAVYLHNALHNTFNFSPITEHIDYVQRKTSSKMEFEDESMRNALANVRMNLNSEYENTLKFRNQISRLLHNSNYELLKERVEKASNYYLTYLYDILYQVMLHAAEAGTFARSKTYVNAVSEIDQLIMSKIADVQKAQRLTACILSNTDIAPDEEERKKRNAKREAFLNKIHEHIRNNPRKGATKTGRRRKTGTKGKPQKGATYQETYNLIKEGLTISQIAVKRSLVEGTIESHVARGIADGNLNIDQFINKEELKEIKNYFDPDTEKTLSEVFAELKGKYTFGKLRMVQAWLSREKINREK